MSSREPQVIYPKDPRYAFGNPEGVAIHISITYGGEIEEIKESIESNLDEWHNNIKSILNDSSIHAEEAIGYWPRTFQLYIERTSELSRNKEKTWGLYPDWEENLTQDMGLWIAAVMIRNPVYENIIESYLDIFETKLELLDNEIEESILTYRSVAELLLTGPIWSRLSHKEQDPNDIIELFYEEASSLSQDPSFTKKIRKLLKKKKTIFAEVMRYYKPNIIARLDREGL